MVACVSGFRSPALLGVPQGVRDTSRLGCGGGLTAAATEPLAALGPGLVHGVVHLPPRGGPAIDSHGAGDCFGVDATTPETTPSSRLVLLAGTGQEANVASAVASIGSALGQALQRIIMPNGAPTPLPGMHDQVPLDQVHLLQCLRNTPLAGTKASRHSDFVFAWALLGRYVHELAWKTANLKVGRPEPQINFGSSPVGQVKGVRTWGQGPYEQGFLPLLIGYGSSHSRLAILPGPDLFMANRYAEVMPPPFVHGYGAKGKGILQLWGNVHRLPTLPESIWGNGSTVPLWASVGKQGSGPVRLQLFAGVLMYWKKEVLSSCKATPKWRSRPNTPKGQLAMLAAASHAWFAQADLPWTLFVEDTKATPLGLANTGTTD